MQNVNFLKIFPVKPFEIFCFLWYNKGVFREKVAKYMDRTEGKFKIGDYVTYRKNGVCQIDDITFQNFVGQGKKEYYVLHSVYDSNMKVFVPLGSELEKEMQYVLTVEEIHRVIDNSNNVENMWDEDCKARAAVFDGIVNSGDKAKMLWLVKAVSEYKLEMDNAKMKMKANDLKYLAQAESIIAADFAFSLKLPKSEVLGYINNYLNSKR